VQQAVSSFRHEGVARELLHAFKFGRMPGLASIMAGFMAENLDDGLAAATVVAVPAAALRQRLRGFDPAALLSRRLCELAGLPPPASGVIKRTGRGRQRGRGREERMAAPPAIEPVSGIDGPILLVDDVITTGATISICAATLKRCGAGPVTALSFTRRV
jgi:predicted amidophosphoribosyltransferase